jgi:hypothetical protein
MQKNEPVRSARDRAHRWGMTAKRAKPTPQALTPVNTWTSQKLAKRVELLGGTIVAT